MADDMSNLLGTVIVGGIAMKVADNLTRGSNSRPRRQQQQPRKKRVIRKQSNPFNRNSPSPF